MKKSLMDLSHKKIDASITAVCEAIAKAADSSGICFFVVGAAARDVIFGHGYNIPIPRATLDVDFAVKVSGWDEFARLKDALIATGEFGQTGSLPVDRGYVAKI